MTIIRPFLIVLLALASAPAGAQHRHDAPAPPACPPGETGLACAKQASPVFLGDGTLVLVWSAGGRVMVARSTDRGASLGPAVAVNAAVEAIDESGDARPAIAADSRGRVFVAYALRKEVAFSGTVMLSRSDDGGLGFAPPRKVASDPTSQRFPVLGVGESDRLYLAWIDKRGLAAAKAAGQSYRGAALAMAWSDDGGDSFVFEGAAQHSSCECCRIAMAIDRHGRPVLVWRHLFAPNIRDHAVMSFTGRDSPGPLRRLSEDDWRIDACPHHGPALAVAADGSAHAAWYTAGGNRKGLFLARAASAESQFGEPRPIGRADRSPSHPQLLALGARLHLAWREFDGEVSRVMAQHSDDAGVSWSPPREIAATRNNSDRPVLVSDGRRAFLSWLTRAEGWRLTALEPAP
ncbi:sialidase family protein [Magnetospirillum sp. SS-4]|uniref:sialidase family protein n=1 Tax=Magnetospirillum sp. SS-4 TaxID=2681465 RepID=UPI00137F5EEC|nr:sialidase family protein [Magnetospirillum sp. SS-4]CAA7626204.1 conserved exported hypothetical protein [Magnetospirillum sp. SS-4]